MPDEFAFIARMKRFIPTRADVGVGIGDDAAVLPGPAGKHTLLATDMLVEGRHFFPDADLYNVGRKAFAVNVSDIAAMGGRPAYAVVSLGIPEGMTLRRAERLYQGFYDECVRHGATIVGGDTVAAPVLTINVALQGEVEPEGLLLRRGALVGDQLWVTGRLGDAAAGLLLRQRPDIDAPYGMRQRLELALERPVPRVEAGRVLGEGWATAAMDVSDGIAGDVRRLAEASRVGAVIDEGALPVSDDVRWVAAAAGVDPLDLALSGGEDFELLFTTSGRLPKSVLGRLGVQATPIGEIVPASEGLSRRRVDGTRVPLDKGGYVHF